MFVSQETAVIQKILARGDQTESAVAHQTILTILDSMEAIIYAADIETFAILFMNRRMREVFKQEEMAQPCFKVVHRRSSPCENCTRHQLLDAQGNPREAQIWEAMDADKTRWYLHHNRAVRWADGRYVRLHVATDISAVKLLEQERIQNETRMRQTQKMEALGTLAGGIAHDFNNILSAILGYADLALDDARRGIAAPAYVGQIISAGQRARDLVQQILTFSRQTETEAKPIQIQPIVKEALKLLRAALPSTIAIELKIESETTILADPVQIHQVIMNLCTNAGHAMRADGGQLNVLIAEEVLGEEFARNHHGVQPGPHLLLEVRDTGHGIAPAHLDKIFDPYFTTKGKSEGTGLGLAVVQGIVQSCRGAIAVESTLGQGTAFKIYLPISSRTGLAASAIESLAPVGRERILFVDDELPLAELGKELLERLGYHVTIRTKSIEALALFERHPLDFDLVITDMTMPFMTGEQLAEKLLLIRPKIPIIICTGYSQRVTPEMMARLGIRALLMKPLIRNDMAAAIRKALDNPVR
ncbi:MAG: ATP-binding protein [Desulfobacteraceae bacterium]|nr:ATP-binding protein [Desulfobacteraceae bacterium]